MYTDVYVDVLFFINFSMDAVSLFVTARLCAVRVSIFRIALGACIGAIYSVTVLFFEFAAVFGSLIFVCVCFIMTSVSLRPSRFAEALKMSIVLFVSSALLGGIMSSLYNIFTDTLSDFFDSSSTASNLTPIVIFALATVSLLASLFLTRLHGSGNLPRQCDVEIYLFGKKTILRGMLDSGNLLRDPISGRSVVLVKASLLGGCVSPKFLDDCTNYGRNTFDSMTNEEKKRFRLIPAKGIGKTSCLYGLVPDKLIFIYVCAGKTLKVERDAIIAVMHDYDCDVDCIVPSSIF